MLRFEAALARAEAAAGVIPDAAATAIGHAAMAPVTPDLDALHASLRANATLSAPSFTR
jgi:adenylosuccinate lyase